MKTIENFISERQGCTCLEDFILTAKEWTEFEPETKAIRVKTYNSEGNLVNREYVLEGIDNVDEVLEEMQAVSAGYFTDTCRVRKKAN